MYEQTDTRPTTDDAEGLKLKYSLDQDYDLKTELHLVFTMFELWSALYQNDDVKPPGEARKVLTRFQKQCNSLRESITELRLIEKALLDIYYGDAIESGLARVEHELRAMADAASEGLARIQGKKGRPKGRRRNVSLYIDLRRVWSEAADQPSEVKHIRHLELHDDYKGPFLDFVIDCLETRGIKYESRAAVGRALQRLPAP